MNMEQSVKLDIETVNVTSACDDNNQQVTLRMEQQCYMGLGGVDCAAEGSAQVRIFQNLHTLSEVSSLQAGQQDEFQFHSQSLSLTSTMEPLNLIQQPIFIPPGVGQVGRQPDSKEQTVKEKKPRKRGKAAQVRPCQVCGERAGKHFYYGGEVCPSCRAFFRRSVQSSYNDTYQCVSDGSCQVTLATRKNCQFCRYKLCLASGMKSVWVLTEEERKQKFAGKGKTKRKSENVEEDINKNLSEEEMLEVNDLVKASGHFEMSKVNDMETSLIRNIVKMIAFCHPLPIGSQKQLKEVLAKRFKKISKRIPEFQMLSYKDREEISTQNIPLLVEMQICSFFKPDVIWQDQFIPLMGQEEVDMLYKKLKSLSVTGLDDLYVPYSYMFSHTCAALQNLTHFQETVKDIGGWAQDGCETVLLSLILLFCPDMLDLLERRRVEDIQTKFAVLLHKYLNHRHKPKPWVSVSRFARGLNLVTKCKELQHMVAGLDK